MRSSELKRAKRRIRRAVLSARDALPAELRPAMGERIADRFLGLPEVEGATTVMLFWSFGSEVPTARPIERLHERGVTIALPRIEGGELVPVRFAPGDPTEPTSFGAREPVDGSSIEPARLDVVAVPGVAFDLQVLDEQLPAGGSDVRVDLIVTESETIRPGRDLNSRSTS